MTKDQLYEKIQHLDAEIARLNETVDQMSTKMDKLEELTALMKTEVVGDMQEFVGELQSGKPNRES